MKTTVLGFHPNWDQSRVNKTLANGLDQQIEVRNMYQLYPDFKIDVEKEHQVLEAADRIVFAVSNVLVQLTSFTKAMGR